MRVCVCMQHVIVETDSNYRTQLISYADAWLVESSSYNV